MDFWVEFELSFLQIVDQVRSLNSSVVRSQYDVILRCDDVILRSRAKSIPMTSFCDVMMSLCDPVLSAILMTSFCDHDDVIVRSSIFLGLKMIFIELRLSAIVDNFWATCF